MSKLRKSCVRIVPLGTIFMWVLIELAWYLPAAYHGWPDVPFRKINPIDMVPAMVFFLLLTNLPDLISICIFVKMHIHFKKASINAVQPIALNQQIAPPDDEYGGIWVGGNGDYPVGGNPDQNIGHGAGNDNANYHHHQQQSEHGAKAVMKSLKRHVIFSLTDVSILALAFAFCHPVSKPAGYLYNIAFSFWVPFFVIKSSFKQLENIKLCF